jgi:hypothetical protein
MRNTPAAEEHMCDQTERGAGASEDGESHHLHRCNIFSYPYVMRNMIFEITAQERLEEDERKWAEERARKTQEARARLEQSSAQWDRWILPPAVHHGGAMSAEGERHDYMQLCNEISFPMLVSLPLPAVVETTCACHAFILFVASRCCCEQQGDEHKTANIKHGRGPANSLRRTMQI